MRLLYEAAARYFEERNAHTRCEFSKYNIFYEYKSTRRETLESLMRRSEIFRKFSSRQRAGRCDERKLFIRHSHKFPHRCLR